MTRTQAMFWTAAVALICAVGNARAADPAPDTAKAAYDAERARCASGTTGQDQASCLRSAGAAYDAIRGNRMQDANTAYRDNATVRCKALPAADQADCMSRIDGGGTSSGSVKDGGIIRETVTKSGTPSNSPVVPPVK